MRHLKYIISLFIALGTLVAPTSAQDLWLEAESFADHGGWSVDQQFMDEMGSPYLLAHGWGVPVKDAATKIVIPQNGTYHVFVRTSNWTSAWSDKRGPGRFSILINGQTVGGVLGDRGGLWHWQKAGKIQLKAGTNTLSLHDLTGFDGRCDAVLITRHLDPRLIPSDSLKLLRSSLAKRAYRNELVDLCVIGGGIAGICAAMSAARLGCRVALIHDRPVLGGPNSSEIQIAIGGKIELGPNAGLGRMLREFTKTHPGNAQIVSKDEDQLKDSFITSEPNITFLKEYHATRVVMDGNKISSVIAENIITGDTICITAHTFADCTGDGTIGFLAGADYRIGRESRSEYEESLAPVRADSLTLGSTVKWSSKENEQPQSFPKFEYGMPFTDSNCQKVTQGAWNWEFGMGMDQVKEAEKIRDYALLTIYSNWSWLKNGSRWRKDYSKRSLSWVGYILGKRESRRLLGDYVLSQQDIDKNVKHEDATCETTWSMDLHLPDSVNTQQFPTGPFLAKAVHRAVYPYAIPYRCLYSRNINNLFMAGRDISATHVAFSSTRVMCTTAMMGETVGMAAWLSSKYSVYPRDIYRLHMSELKVLMQKGIGRTDDLPSMKYEFYSSLDKPRLETDGTVLAKDSVGNPVAVVGAYNIWQQMNYNRKYGFGGFPRGKGKLPYYSLFRGVLEADMLSVRGGHGRWNGSETGNFKQGSHVFEGWNQKEDARLTMGIGTVYKDIGWLQVFHPAEKGDDKKYYGITKIGSDMDDQGVDFLPSVALSKSPFAVPVMREAPRTQEKDIEVLKNNRQIDSTSINADAQGIIGSLYYDANDNVLKVLTPTGWRSVAFEKKFSVLLSDKLSDQGESLDGISLSSGTTGTEKAVYGHNLVTTVNADKGNRPRSIAVRIGGTPIDCDYDASTGKLIVQGENINGDVYIYRGVDIKLNGKEENPGSALSPGNRLAIWSDYFGKGRGCYHREAIIRLKVLLGGHISGPKVYKGHNKKILLNQGADYSLSKEYINDGELYTFIIYPQNMTDEIDIEM